MEDIQNYVYDSNKEDNINLNQRNSENKRKLSKIIFCEDFESGEKRNIKSVEGSLYNSENEKQKRESLKSCEYSSSSKNCNGNNDFEEKLNNSLWNLRRIQGRKPIFRYSESIENRSLTKKKEEAEKNYGVDIGTTEVSNPEKKKENNLNFDTQKWKSFNDFSDFAIKLPKCENDDSLSISHKKRSSSVKRGTTKKVKLDFEIKMDTEISPGKCLKTELELENNRLDTTFKRRNINTIIEELELISKKCKEGYAKYKFPVQWGSTIVKNCSEKWDSQYIPAKILERYQKYFKTKKSSSSSLLIESLEPNDAEIDVKFIEEKNSSNESEKTTDIENVSISKLNESDNYQGFTSASKQIGEDANYSFNSDVNEKMVLRSRNLNRVRLEEGAETSSEYFTKEKQSKKNMKMNKDKKINPKCQLIISIERCKTPVDKDSDETNLDSNKNYEMEWKMEDSGSQKVQLETAKSQHEDSLSAETSRLNKEECVTCPICDKKFKKSFIEDHATECASATFRD